MNYKNSAEIIAQIIENENTQIKVANKLWRHVRETIKKADITHPETIRLLYPIAAQIVTENERKTLKFQVK